MSDRSRLAAFLLLTVGGGLLIGAFTAPGEWYEALVKPPFNPPNWLFGPVWTALYVLIGFAGWRIWRAAPQSLAMKLWWAQLVLNFLWSPVFFALRSPGAALIIIVLLLVALTAFIVKARKIDESAALMFVPYFLWVGFATALNASIWWLN